MSDILTRIDAAVADGKLSKTTRDNIAELLESSDNPLYAESIGQLLDAVSAPK